MTCRYSRLSPSRPTRSRGSSDMVKVAKRISNPSVRGGLCYSGISRRIECACPQRFGERGIHSAVREFSMAPTTSPRSVRRNKGLRHGTAFERCWTTARNQHARRETPWRVVFCEKMKNEVRNGRGIPVPPDLQPVENGAAAVGLAWSAKMATANPQATRALV
jgi:hypothetical protein